MPHSLPCTPCYPVRRSIIVVSREPEGILNDPDLGRITCHHFDHIESKRYVRHVQHPQPCHRSRDDSPALLPINCIDGSTVVFVGPRLHFDEHERVRIPIAADQINLSALCEAHVSTQHLVAIFGEMACRQPLAPPPQLEMRSVSRGPGPSAPPARKCVDEWDTAHGG